MMEESKMEADIRKTYKKDFAEEERTYQAERSLKDTRIIMEGGKVTEIC